MHVRDWTGADYYRELGVSTTATRDEIAAAFRARARVLHPDTGPADPAAEERFVRAATAYRVLSGPLREEYDRARRRGQIGRPAPAATSASAARASKPWQLSRRGARVALASAIFCIVAGVVTAGLVIGLQVRDARLRAQGIAVDALVVREDGVPRLEYRIRDGQQVRVDVPDLKSGGWSVGETVAIRYDKETPTRVVTQQHSLARDITLWIVAVKLLVVGVVLAVVAIRRLVR